MARKRMGIAASPLDAHLNASESCLARVRARSQPRICGTGPRTAHHLRLAHQTRVAPRMGDSPLVCSWSCAKDDRPGPGRVIMHDRVGVECGAGGRLTTTKAEATTGSLGPRLEDPHHIRHPFRWNTRAAQKMPRKSLSPCPGGSGCMIDTILTNARARAVVVTRAHKRCFHRRRPRRNPNSNRSRRERRCGCCRTRSPQIGWRSGIPARGRGRSRRAEADANGRGRTRRRGHRALAVQIARCPLVMARRFNVHHLHI